MALVPVMLEFAGRRVLVVGGGSVAARRAKSLARAGAEVTVIAPVIDDSLQKAANIRCEPRPLDPADLELASDQAPLFGVVAATDDPTLNQSIAEAARSAGAWAAIADAPTDSDVQFMATASEGPLTLCVHTGGASANAATRVRDELLAALDAAWPQLLAAAAQHRAAIQAAITDDAAQRQALLRRLVDEEALRTLKRDGPEALDRHHAALLTAAGISPNTAP